MAPTTQHQRVQKIHLSAHEVFGLERSGAGLGGLHLRPPGPQLGAPKAVPGIAEGCAPGPGIHLAGCAGAGLLARLLNFQICELAGVRVKSEAAANQEPPPPTGEPVLSTDRHPASVGLQPPGFGPQAGCFAHLQNSEEEPLL